MEKSWVSMIKKTMYFGNPIYLSYRDGNLIAKFDKAMELDDTVSENADFTRINKSRDKYQQRALKATTIPIEDIGVLVIDSYGVTISQHLISKLLESNVALITCNESHHPTGLMLNLDGNAVQSEKFRSQISASQPLKKQLWQQTVATKIKNQAALLRERGVETGNMLKWAKSVKSGDSSNLEARASAYYWKKLFGPGNEFYRDRFGDPPNNLLNYAYAIQRAMTARALVGSGLLPTLGIHHRNKYNAYCLADDIMEPYRPFADRIVCDIADSGCDMFKLDKELKKKLLSVTTADVLIRGLRSPLMAALSRTSASLAKCFEKKAKSIIYPAMD